MNRQKLVMALGVMVLIAAVIVVGGFVYVYATAGSGEASAPISAPALVSSSSAQQNFEIDDNSSKVQFTLTEELLGKPTTVVGTTNQVAGDILIDLDHPANTQIGTIRINARTLATDSDMRDRTTRSQILGSSQDQYEYINFVPIAITGLPDKLVAGTSYTFQVTGDLTVRGVTKSTTFDVSAKLVTGSPDHLDGSATATIHRADFNLTIPNVPSVANVSDEVKLQIDFVAPASTVTTTAS